MWTQTLVLKLSMWTQLLSRQFREFASTIGRVPTIFRCVMRTMNAIFALRTLISCFAIGIITLHFAICMLIACFKMRIASLFFAVAVSIFRLRTRIVGLFLVLEVAILWFEIGNDHSPLRTSRFDLLASNWKIPSLDRTCSSKFIF